MHASIITLLVLDYEWLCQSIFLNLKHCASLYYWTFSTLSGRCCKVQQVLEQHWENKGLLEFLNIGSISNENVCVWLRKVPHEEFLLETLLGNCRSKEETVTLTDTFLQYLISAQTFTGHQGTFISDSLISVFCSVQTNDIVDKGAEVLTKVGEGERDSQMDLAKVVPGLTSLEMLVPQVQAATVNVVQVSGSSAVANPQPPVPVTPGQNSILTPVSVVSGPDVGDSNSSGHGITDIRDNRSLVHQNCASVAEQVSDTLSKADDSHTIQESSQVSPHIQKVGQPYKTKEHTESEQEEKTVYRLIMKEGRGMEQYYSTEQALDNVISGTDSNNAVSYSQDIIKIFKKKKERESSKINESTMASLPKFQHAFGRQLYQSMDGGTSVVPGTGDNESGSQFSGTTISESSTRANESVVVVAEKEDSTLSKAVQTVLKEAESTKMQTQSTTQQHQSPQPMTKETPEMTNQSQGVIFTCKVPISISNSTLLQGKPVAILKSSSDLIVHGPKISEEIKKDSVIRSNMSALLAAALQTTPIKNTTNLKKQDKGDVIVRESTNKVHVAPAQVQKSKRPTSVQTGGSKLVRSENLQTGTSSPSSLVTIPLPARTVVLAMNQPRTVSSSTSNISNKIDRTDQTNVCSSTLEQLREFESVLEHVTNTSQMKERCVKKPGTSQPSSVAQEVLTVQSQSQQTQVSHQTTIAHQTIGQPHNSNNQQQQTSTATTPSSPKETTPTHTSTEFTTPIEITERVVTLVSKGGSTTVQAVQTTGNVQKMSATPVVVVQSCSSRQSSPSPTPSHKLKISKPKAKSSSICKTTPITATSTTTLKVSALTKPQQKPQEDEQTTQRIYAILDKYAEQLRNSPELKNKPAPRRRSNPPTNPAQSSKRKKGSKKSTGCCSVDASPIDGCCEDIRTLGSEDSSTEPPATPAPIRHTDDISLPAHLQPEDVSSETCESSTDSKEVTTQTVQQSPSNSGQHQPAVRQINQQQNQQLEKQQTVTGRTLLVQESLHAGSVLNVEQATKVLSGKQLVVGTPATVPLTLSLPAAANLKQVIFPVPADGRPFVVAKVPKMYRVHQVTVPGNSPLIAASTGGAVLLRQMCLNKTTVKQVKVPVQVSGITGSSGVVLPGGSQSFTLEGDSLVLDNNTILVNTGHGPSNSGGVTVSSSGATVSLLQRTTATTATCGSNRTTSSTMTSHHDHVFTQDQALQTHNNLNHNDIKYVNRSGEIVDERVQKQPWLHILREIKVADDQASLEGKEDIATADKGCSAKENSGKYMVESVIKVKPSINSEKNDGGWHSLTSTPTSAAVLSVKSTPSVGRRGTNTTPVSVSLTQDSWRKSRDLRLQKSLSEECEDLGVDKPSTSDLFPEAELLLDTDPLSRDSLHEMYSSSSRDSSPTPRYQWKKRGMTSRLLGKRQESDSSCPSTPLNGDPGEDESETGSECDWWPGTGENGRSHHGLGITTSGTATITPLTQMTRKRKIGLYATDSDDTDLDDSSSEKGTSLKSSCPPLKRECQYVNGSPARRETIKSTTNTVGELQQQQQDSIDHHVSQNYITATQVSHCTTISSTTTITGKTDIGQRIKNTNTAIQSNIRQQPINRKR